MTSGLMLKKKQSPPAGQVPVSAYGGRLKNLKDLKVMRTSQPLHRGLFNPERERAESTLPRFLRAREGGN